MRSKLYAFMNVLDAAMTISKSLTSAFGIKISINKFTDSKQVFDVITRGKRPTEEKTIH